MVADCWCWLILVDGFVWSLFWRVRVVCVCGRANFVAYYMVFCDVGLFVFGSCVLC